MLLLSDLIIEMKNASFRRRLLAKPGISVCRRLLGKYR
jgi:hypothetical protein